MSWYDTSFRKLFFDFHSPGATVGLAADFDAEGWADRLKEAGAEAVSVFVKGGYGYSFYRKGEIRYVHPSLPEGLDMVQEQIDALHARGLKAIGYYHTFNSEPVARDHPEWRRVNAEGEADETSICMLGPLTDEWMLPHIAEAVRLYDLDALFFDGTYGHAPCYCDACQAAWADASGGAPIPISYDDANAKPYVAWLLTRYRELRQRICDAIHEIKPDMVVSFNWAYAPRMPEPVPEGVGNLVADIFPDDQAFNGSYFGRYWSLLGVPFDIMNTAFLQWWGDWGCKPAVAMQQEVATILAHGGLTWIGYQMNERFDVEPAVMGELGKTLAFVKEREPWLVDAEPILSIGVLHSTSAHLAQDKPATWIDETSARGAHRMLTESMLPYHLMNEVTLDERLDELQVLILPGQRYLSGALVSRITDWVRDGGVLVAAGLSGTLDDAFEPTGRMALEEVLGVEMEGVYDQTHAYVEVIDPRLEPGTLDMPHLAEATFALAKPVADDVQPLARLRAIYLRSDGKPLLRWSPVGEDTGYPAITMRRYGRGWASYVAGDLFRAYQAKNAWNLKHIVANLLGVLRPDLPVEVDAPAWVE
ncbi:MAG: beta-galactosidase trimerization domain-containing protein, partial [Anaerolineae bacterium]